MSEERLVTIEIDEAEGVAVIKMNRPRKKNALSIALLQELRHTIGSIKENEKLRCIVLCSEGDSFSSGRDLHDLRGASSRRAIWPGEFGLGNRRRSGAARSAADHHRGRAGLFVSAAAWSS